MRTLGNRALAGRGQAGRFGSPPAAQAGRSGSPPAAQAGRSGSPPAAQAGRSGSPSATQAGRSGSPSAQTGRDRQGGQAAVELALVLPLVAMLLLALLQVGLVVREQILVVHAAREGAREAAVDPSPGAARDAALASSGLDPDRLRVAVSGRGGAGSRVQVTTRYGPPTAVPLVGAAVGRIQLQATATMRVER